MVLGVGGMGGLVRVGVDGGGSWGGDAGAFGERGGMFPWVGEAAEGDDFLGEGCYRGREG